MIFRSETFSAELQSVQIFDESDSIKALRNESLENRVKYDVSVQLS